jgi:chromosome segregation ATPase
MTLQIDFWQLVLAIGGILAAMVAIVWAFSRIIINSIDQRFKRLDEDIRKVETATHENEKEVLRLRADLPNEYVRREDWIRFTGVIDCKLDTLSAKIDAFRERMNVGN